MICIHPQKVSSRSQAKMSSSSSTETKVNEVISQATQLETFQSEKVSHHEQTSFEAKKTSNVTQHIDETVVNAATNEEIPKISTQSLKQHFEKTAQGKMSLSGRESGTPAKQIKIENGYEEMIWPSAAFASSTETASGSRQQEIYMAKKTGYASTAAYSSSSKYGSTEEFPPPPSPDLLQASSEIADFSQSPEPSPPPAKHVLPKDLYSKQRNLYELKRLYKHIHPEMRKSLEKEYFNDISEIVSSDTELGSSVAGDVHQARYVFENTGNSPQKCMSPEREYLEWDEILKGEVQSMRWIFEHQPLDSIKDESPDPDKAKSIADQEIIAGGDVKYTTWMFETQPIDALGTHSPENPENADKIPELARGDVRTATWMFETQPLDSMNKIHHEKEEECDETSTEEITGGDVKTVRYMFETQHLDRLGQLCSVDEAKLLQLKSELQEIKGDVKRSIRHFETLPMYVIRNNLGQMLEIKTVHREDLEKGDVRTVRWMFETQPLDMINKDSLEIKVVHGISMEESVKGEVGKAKWLFETQPLDTIKEDSEVSVVEKEVILGTDVCRKCWLFETQPLDTLKESEYVNPVPAEEIIGGDVSTTKHLFETLPMDMLKDSPDVGKLQKLAATEEEKGDVRHQKWIFETQPLEQIREERKEFIKTVKLEEIDKGDVNSCKHAFETYHLNKFDDSYKIHVEGVTRGAVKLNKALFEMTPLYAIQDSLGKYHEVKTIRQEEVVRGDVRNCRWLFETRPIDQFDESIEKIEIIKGISSQEVQSGDVKTAKWLFETQPLDSIKYFSNVEDEESREQTETTDIVKGDVRMCRWLFETQPMESLYDKVEAVTHSEEIHRGDVKTCTWLFETQPLDAIREDSETAIKLHTVMQDDIQGSDVRTACFLFETENLENIQGKEGKEFKRVVEIDIQPGDVSTMRYKFENQSLDSINFSSESEEVSNKIKTIQSEDIQKGDVLHCCWLFENRSIDEITEHQEERASIKTVTDIQGGNVRKGCFVFETFSLDQIKDESSEEGVSTKKTISEEEITKGDVKSYRMLFETQPFYAIQDKEGYYHEVTTVKKEEVLRGDVRGTRWLFETKPLGSINKSDNIYIIKSVTQEDIQKGDVSSVRYRFETQPLDTISDEEKLVVPTVDSVQGGDVKANKKLFESEEAQKGMYVRTVSVSEIQRGNVKTSTWLFETHTIDEIRGEGSEYNGIKTVTKEDVQEGDVQHAVWLFENQPLASIKEMDDSDTKIEKEEIPQADVKTTTWLFETTPFHEFNESKVEKEEIIGKSVKETLKELYSHKVVETHGIILEADEIGDVRMAKYRLMNQEAPEIQKEEIIKGDLANIMLNLLSKPSTVARETKVNEEEKGNVNLTKEQLLNRSTDVQIEKEEIVRGDIQQAIKNLFSKDSSATRGILIQENERGDINMTVYSLFHKKASNKTQQDEVIGGDVKRTIHSLLSSAMNNEISQRAKIDDSERGNVQFFTTCIEAGALDYLKLLQTGTNETFARTNQEEEEEIIGGDVEGTKLLLKKKKSQIQRTVNETDIIPGDVCNAVKIFMTEPQNTSCHVCKEEIIKGDLKAALNSLSQAINQTTVTEKEEIIKADILAILKSLKESAYRLKETEKPDVIPGDIKQAIESLEKAMRTQNAVFKEEVVRGDLESTLRSLKAAQQSFKEISKEVIRGDIQTSVENLLEASVEKKTIQCEAGTSGTLKRIIEVPFESPQQFVKNQVSATESVQHKTKSHQEHHEVKTFENKSFSSKDTRAIHLDQKQSMKAHEADKKNVKCLLNVQHKVTEKADKSLDKVNIQNIAKKEAKSHTNQYEIDQSASCRNIHKNERAEKLEESRIKKKDHLSSSVRSSKALAGKKESILHQCKDEVHFGITNQEEIREKSNLSVCDHSASHRGEEHLVNVSMGMISKATGHFGKQEVQQDRIQSQHSKEAFSEKQNNVKASQAAVSMASEQNIKTNQKIRVTQEMHTQFKEAERKQKCSVIQQNEKSMQKFRGKAEVEAAESGFRVLRNNPLNPKKNPKILERSDSNSPPPPPPPPSPPVSVTSSEADLPLPPPPPLSHLIMSSDRQSFPSPPPPIGQAKIEYDHFPPPPPPVEDKLERELESPLLPPPLLQPSAIPQPKQKKEHFLKHLDKTLQQSTQLPGSAKPGRSPSIKKHPQTDSEGSQPKTAKKFQPSIVHTHKESSTSKTREESTEHTTMQTSISQEQKEEKVCTRTEEVGRPLSVPEEVKPEMTAIKKISAFPLPRSPSLPAEATQMKPKPYVRKFKTPLMIAEENYRRQREQMEQKQVKDACQLVVRRHSESWGSSVYTEAENDLPKPEGRSQTPLQGPLLSAAPEKIPIEPEQVAGLQGHDEPQPTSQASATEQSQDILKTSVEDYIRKKALQDAQHLIKHCASSQNVQTQREHTVHKTEQQKNEAHLHVSKNKTVSPTFKVRTIKLPTLDQSFHETHQDLMGHKRQAETSMQTTMRPQIQAKQKENASSVIQKKQSIAKTNNHVHVEEKQEMEQLLEKHTEGRQEVRGKEFNDVKQRLVQRKETGKEEIKQESEGKQTQVIACPKEEKVVIQRKQEISTKPEKMVKQKIIDIHQGSHTVTSEQKKTHLSKTKVESKTSSLENSSRTLQGRECAGETLMPQKKNLIKTAEPKQELALKKSLVSNSSRGLLQSNEKSSVDILEFLRKREEVQQVLSRVKELESEPSTNGVKTFQTFLHIIPGWLIEQDRKQKLTCIAQENNVEQMKEELSAIKYQASKMLESCEEAIQAAMTSTKALKSRKDSLGVGEVSQKIAKVSIGSSRKDVQKTTEMIQDKMAHQEVKQLVSAHRVSEIKTPLSLRTRAPSPTYITIESRRIDSPLREVLSPVQREGTPIPPSPPPRSATPTSKVQQSVPSPSPSPSPPRSRSEQLAKLKDTTVKLSQGATQTRSVTPVPIMEKRSEIVKSPATLRRQIKIETRQSDVLLSKVPPVNESQVAAGTVKKLKEAHKESEASKTTISKKTGNIPEVLGSCGQNVNALSVTQTFEGSKADHKGLVCRSGASEQMLHIRREADLSERSSNENEEKIAIPFGKLDKSVAEAKSKTKCVENGVVSGKIKGERHRTRKEKFGQISQESEIQKDSFPKFSDKKPKEPKENKSYRQKQCVVEEHLGEPTVCFDTKSHSDCSSTMDTFENTVVESRTATSTSRSAEGTQTGFGYKRAPPTYEDVISGHILDISAADTPEELLRNFQKTWQESERVFKSLGYTVSDAAELRSSFHEEAEFISGK
ncbi:hypothetical protein lerEdw1_017457 [Lerista edwardsae]|nr:hypothetical protein lerEdw1_017457 [Lerista edwardsae]